MDILFIFQCLYLMVPAYIANMAPVFFKNHFNVLAVPIDAKKMLWGRPLFGSHKTWRGLVVGTVFGVIAAGIQFMLSHIPEIQRLEIVSYDNWIFLGLLMGVGALLGDLIKSFIKRRFTIAPGNRFFPFDQMDFALGSLLCASIIVTIQLKVIITCILLSIVLHVATNHVAFYTGFRNEKW